MSNGRPVFAIPENIFPRSLANEIHYDVDENLWSNPQDMVDKKHRSAARDTLVDILL